MDAHFLVTYIPLFRRIPTFQLRRIATEASIETVAKGGNYYRGLLTPRPLLFLLSGLVGVREQATDCKHRYAPYLFTSQHWILLNDNIVGADSPLHLEIFRESAIICLPYELVHQLAKQDTQFALQLLETAAKESIGLQTYTSQLIHLDAAGRLALFLLHLAREIFHNKHFKLPFRQDTIGSMLGLSREVVNRLLKQWCAEGIIQLERHEIELCNREVLEHATKRNA